MLYLLESLEKKTIDIAKNVLEIKPLVKFNKGIYGSIQSLTFF